MFADFFRFVKAKLLKLAMYEADHAYSIRSTWYYIS